MAACEKIASRCVLDTSYNTKVTPHNIQAHTHINGKTYIIRYINWFVHLLPLPTVTVDSASTDSAMDLGAGEKSLLILVLT